MKKLMKVMALFCIAALLIVGCGGKTEPAKKSEETKGTEQQAKKEDGKKHHVFGYTCMTMNNPFFQTVEKSIREVVEKHGDTLITTDPAMDVNLQINQIEDMITQGIEAIFLNPVDWEGIRPALEKLKAANVKIINFDTEVKDFQDVDAYVGSDNKNAGKVCGEDLVKRFPNGGNIVILDSPTMNSVNDRIEGFEEAIKGHNFKVVAQQDAKGDLPTAMNLTEDILQANKDIVAIMGGNDPTALGALAAAKAANRKDVIIYGVDGSPDAKKEIKNGGQLVGTGAQSPKEIGKLSAEVCYKIMNGEKFEKRTPVPTFFIDKNNVDKYGTDGWQ